MEGISLSHFGGHLSETTEPFGIHWFRRDLRVAGNPALRRNWQRTSGRTVGIFCFDPKFLSRPDFSPNRFQFFIHTLIALRDELRCMGSDLLVLDEGPDLAFDRLRQWLAPRGLHPGLLTFNRDYEPFARERDQKMQQWFAHHGIPVETDSDHLLIEPAEIQRGGSAGGPYQVYSPFARRWLEVMRQPTIQGRISAQKLGLAYLQKLSTGNTEPIFRLQWADLISLPPGSRDILDQYQKKNLAKVTVPIPSAGSLAAFDQLKSFAQRLAGYGSNRDFPQVDGTSRLSIFLKNGSLTIAQVIAFLQLHPYDRKSSSSADKFLSQLIWREFYYHILFHFPFVEHEAFIPKFRAIAWPNDPAFFEAWTEGRTGFPIVDAGMRQLKATGWMHNRVRMIVASFLTKDLLIDWRWGERYFMEQLLDGDLAPNNGGWQWAASTGCDPQPYFRIFNPALQSKKFDPEGKYIKQFVPELQGISPKQLHEPGTFKVRGYPQPVVSHAVQRMRALQLYDVSPP
jgi:deoxyribodipyrimidine photo-lyase